MTEQGTYEEMTQNERPSCFFALVFFISATIQILPFQTFQGSLGAEGARGDTGFYGSKVCIS